MVQCGDKIVLCNHQHAHIKFSKDGKMFAIYCKHDTELKVYTDYEDPIDLLEKIKNNDQLKNHKYK